MPSLQYNSVPSCLSYKHNRFLHQELWILHGSNFIQISTGSRCQNSDYWWISFFFQTFHYNTCIYTYIYVYKVDTQQRVHNSCFGVQMTTHISSPANLCTIKNDYFSGQTWVWLQYHEVTNILINQISNETNTFQISKRLVSLINQYKAYRKLILTRLVQASIIEASSTVVAEMIAVFFRQVFFF